MHQLHSFRAEYHDRYQRKETETDLNIVIQQCLESIRLMSDDYSKWVHWLQSLETGYQNRYLKKEIQADLDAAIEQFQEFLDHHISHTLDRLRSDILITRLHVKAEDWLLTHQTVFTMVSLITLLTTCSLKTSDRQNLLTEVADLTSDVAAVTLMMTKSPYEMIQLLKLDC